MYIMRQSISSSSTSIRSALEKLKGIESMIASEPLIVSDRPKALSEALALMKADLFAIADSGAARETEVLRSREDDLATITENGGIDDQRTIFVLYMLLKEFGPVLLSDEGLRRLADCMREPVRQQGGDAARLATL